MAKKIIWFIEKDLKKIAPPERRRTEKEKKKNVLGKSRENVMEKKNTSFAEVGKRSEGKGGNIIS